MTKKNRIRAGLTFSVPMTIFFILEDLLTHDNLTTKEIVIIVVSGLFGGALGGLLVGWLIGFLPNSKLFTKGTKIETRTDETILFETGANHFKGLEGVGGKLYLTNKRLVFKSHKFNIQNHELSISLTDIDKVDRYKPLGLTNNGLLVTSVKDVTDKFVVEQPEEWFNILTEKNGLQQ